PARNGRSRLLQTAQNGDFGGCSAAQAELSKCVLLDLDESLRCEPLYRPPDLVGKEPAGEERVEVDPPRIFEGAQDPDFDGVESSCRQRFPTLLLKRDISCSSLKALGRLPAGRLSSSDAPRGTS